MPSCPECAAPLPADADACASCGTRSDGGTRTRTATVGPTETGIGEGSAAERPRHGPAPARIAHFTIRRELGAGGMGTVYLARDERMNRDVALKVLSRSLASEKAGRRFEQEAWIAGRLDHPAVVKVYECGRSEDHAYFSMELLDGGSLGDVISNMRLHGRDDGLQMEFGSSRYIHWALRVVMEAARGLDHAHRRGVVHRDVKPMNLLLSRTHGAVKIADFGLALDAEASRMTSIGTVMGTVSFMAPEQIRGESDKIDARTDVYALGVTLFELLTLELPFTGRTQQIYMSQVLTSEARRARKLNARVSRDLDTVLLKALAKDRRSRYQTAGAFADDLDNVLHLRPIAAKPEGLWTRGVKWVRRKPVHAALAATLAVSLPAAAIAAARTVSERNEARRQRLADLVDEARWLGERREYGAMLERAEAALALDPGNPFALRHRAMAAFLRAAAEADPETARRAREGALADIELAGRLLPGAAWPHTVRAYMLEVLGRTDEANAAAAQAGRLRAGSGSDDDLGEEARLAQARGRHEEAVSLYSALIRRHPDSVRSIASRALVYEELGNPDDAFVDYRVAVGLEPDYDLALVDLARMSADRGALDDAEAYLARALEIDPENPFALEIQGAILTHRGRQARVRGDIPAARRAFERAEAATRAALERSDRLVWAELNAASIVGESAKLDAEPDPERIARAIEGYGRVLGKWATPPPGGQERDVFDAALTNLCDAQITARRLMEALATCSRVVELHPDRAVAHYNLAGAYALLGRGDDAIAALRRDLDLGDKDWEYLAADPWFERLRTDPRFTGIVAEMKLRAAP